VWYQLLIAVSSRISRRPAGRGDLTAAVLALLGEPLDDRLIYLLPATSEKLGT